jgi:hypothetical protein
LQHERCLCTVVVEQLCCALTVCSGFRCVARPSPRCKVVSRPLRSGSSNCEALKRLQNGATCDQRQSVQLYSAAREAQRCAGVTGGASPWESSECNAPAPCRGNLNPQRNYGRGCCASCGAASPRPRRTSPSHSAQLRGYVEVARRRVHNRPKLEHWLCPAPGSRRGASQRDLALYSLTWSG